MKLLLFFLYDNFWVNLDFSFLCKVRNKSMEQETNQENTSDVQNVIADKFIQNDRLKLCLSNIGKWVKKQDIINFLDEHNIKYKHVSKHWFLLL